MYSTQHLEGPSKATIENVYKTTNHVLCGEGNTPSVKSQNMFQSILNILTSFGENFSKVPTLFFSKMSNPLSVTIVNNAGVISPEFFENLIKRKEPLITNKPYTCDMQVEKPFNIMRNIHDSFFEDKESNTIHTLDKYIMDDAKVWYCDHKDDNTVKIFPNSKDDTIDDTIDNPCIRKSDLQKYADDDKDTLDYMKDSISSCIDSNDDASIDTVSFHIVSESDIPAEYTNSIKETTISTHLSDICRKVWNGMTKGFYCRKESIDSEIPIKHLHLLKQRRKANTVAMGRGRGRARSQLRRSGVSQTRHRKERTRHDLAMDMQDDYETWQEVEVCHIVQNDNLLDNPSLNKHEVRNTVDFVRQTTSPTIFKFSDMIPKEQKPKVCKIMKQETPKYPTKVRYVPECSMEVNHSHQDYSNKTYDLQNNQFRPRLMSESSADSEDSYCIVFETESETNCTADIDYEETSYEDSDNENNEDNEVIGQMQKVKFNLIPIVHNMIQWDYAYRAARRGPWEEMARDRERFKGRINCIATVLNPILTGQHRSHIWQERFALQE